MRRAFKPSPYGFQRKQVVPVFYATYSSLFVALQLSWKVALTFMCQHAVFYATTMLHIPAATYAVALLMIAMKRFVVTYVLHSVFYQYGPTSFTLSYIAFQWNILRGLSYSVDFIRAERLKPREKRRRLPPYWKSLAYVLYLPTVVLGLPQNYDDYVAQLDKKRPKCTPREVAYCVTRLLRSAAHFVLMEAMTHYLYSSAMAKWPWMIEQLDAASLVGFVMACHFFFYVRHVFTYGFATALARAEAVEIPPQPKCIARISTCSQFWRYFYEPLVGSKKEPARLVLGTAVAFAFTWYWHDMENEVAIWCALSMFGITIEVLVAEARKWAPVRKLEHAYYTWLTSTSDSSSVEGFCSTSRSRWYQCWQSCILASIPLQTKTINFRDICGNHYCTNPVQRNQSHVGNTCDAAFAV
ncbi:hypothetical protein V5799_005916 [Amblyomma americanum]|uniref:Acyltransferase required for palmitoylation of hedgehog hh family of secreted signaling n=1 Tax=Amblyomma americanum TaxID=6943 RepID=A0AAQ4DXX1_AMBAM